MEDKILLRHLHTESFVACYEHTAIYCRLQFRSVLGLPDGTTFSHCSADKHHCLEIPVL